LEINLGVFPATNLMPLCGEAFLFDFSAKNLMPLCGEAISC
jgi:hypothetical protein